MPKQKNEKEKIVWSRMFAQSWNFMKNLISVIWDSFHKGESRSYDFFLSVTDWQMLTHDL